MNPLLESKCKGKNKGVEFVTLEDSAIIELYD